jgi:hypothetical protein
MRKLEHADNGNDKHAVARMGSAYVSLARSRGVSLDYVLEAAANDQLARIIEMREIRRTLNPSLPGWGAKDPIDCLTVLSYKSRDPFLTCDGPKDNL